MMQLSLTAAVLTCLPQAFAAPPECAADNCLRAVRASAFPTRPGRADCSSYFMTIVTPAAATITSTAIETVVVSGTVTTTTTVLRKREQDVGRVIPTDGVGVARRQITVMPSDIPSYASACSGAVRYSSACSCIGVTAQTVTASLPSTTIYLSTSTTTTTTSVFTTTTATATFVLRARSPSPIASRYAVIEPLPNAGFNSQYLTLLPSSDNLTSASRFTIDSSSGHLISLSTGNLANQDRDTGAPNFSNTYNALFFDAESTIEERQLPQPICTGASGSLLCEQTGEGDDGRDTFVWCDGDFRNFVGEFFALEREEEIADGCFPVDLEVVVVGG